ncbi:MAG: hypothetical protein F6J87_14940 [Spirulina sp. SIO3F2]|nr:hypothetical protein [Spirulina sp. SIO3F2]
MDRLSLRIQQTRLRAAAYHPAQGIFRVFAGSSDQPSLDDEVLNPDGSTPYLRQLSVKEAMALTALSGSTEDLEYWLVRVVSTEPLSLNQNWVLTINGSNGFPVQAVNRQIKLGTFEYTLRGNSNGIVISVPKRG